MQDDGPASLTCEDFDPNPYDAEDEAKRAAEARERRAQARADRRGSILLDVARYRESAARFYHRPKSLLRGMLQREVINDKRLRIR